MSKKAYKDYSLSLQEKHETIQTLVEQGKTYDEIDDILYYMPMIKEFVELVGKEAADKLTQRDFEVWLRFPNTFMVELNKLRGLQDEGKIIVEAPRDQDGNPVNQLTN